MVLISAAFKFAYDVNRELGEINKSVENLEKQYATVEKMTDDLRTVEKETAKLEERISVLKDLIQTMVKPQNTDIDLSSAGPTPK